VVKRHSRFVDINVSGTDCMLLITYLPTCLSVCMQWLSCLAMLVGDPVRKSKLDYTFVRLTTSFTQA